MIYRRLIIVLACVLVYLCSSDARPEPCSLLKNSLAKLTVNSYRNESGHWQSQVSFTESGSGSSMIKNKTDSWSLDLELGTTTLAGDEGIIVLATITQGKSRKQIPFGYELFPSVGYYKYYTENVIWARARQICAEDGAHLTIVNSENEANVMKQFFQRFPAETLHNKDAYDSMWVGVYEQGTHGHYLTIFGEALSTTGFTRWHPQAPTDPGTDECVSLYRSNVGLWDLPCSRRAPFACEFQ